MVNSGFLPYFGIARSDRECLQDGGGPAYKLAGMRWREHGTDNVCHLRALFKSKKHQWDAFWERCIN